MRVSDWGGWYNALNPDAPDVAACFKGVFGGSLIAASGFMCETAGEVIASGAAGALAFGRAFIANPDLPQRFPIGAALTPLRSLHLLRR